MYESPALLVNKASKRTATNSEMQTAEITSEPFLSSTDQAILQFSADTNWTSYSQTHFWNRLPGVGTGPLVRGSVPQGCPHFRCQSQGSHASVQLGHKSRVPTIPSSGSIICENSSQNSREPFTNYYRFIRKDTSGTAEQRRCRG